MILFWLRRDRKLGSYLFVFLQKHARFIKIEIKENHAGVLTGNDVTKHNYGTIRATQFIFPEKDQKQPFKHIAFKLL